MLQLRDVTRIDREIAQARYSQTVARAFISVLHDDQSSEMQTSSFAFCLSSCACHCSDCSFSFSLSSSQVYSIGDLQYVNESDLLSLGMSKPQFRKIKRHLPSSSNASLNNNTMFTSTWGKLLVRVSDRARCKLSASTNWCSDENWAAFSYNHIFPPSPFCSSRSCRYLVLVLFSDRHGITGLERPFRAFS